MYHRNGLACPSSSPGFLRHSPVSFLIICWPFYSHLSNDVWLVNVIDLNRYIAWFGLDYIHCTWLIIFSIHIMSNLWFFLASRYFFRPLSMWNSESLVRMQSVTDDRFRKLHLMRQLVQDRCCGLLPYTFELLMYIVIYMHTYLFTYELPELVILWTNVGILF